MGILNGSKKILEKLENGLYNRDITKYSIYIDGDLLIHKGVFEDVLRNNNDPDREVATASYKYVEKLLDHIESDLLIRANEKIVFLDSIIRVKNKRERVHTDLFDKRNTCEIFKNICLENGIKVTELEYGEAEIQMYLKRDQTNSLNIFLTADSDMIPILYNHKPKVFNRETNIIQKYKTFKYRPDENFRNFFFKSKNKIYTNQDNVILDSCLWVNCRKIISVIGCDYNRKRLKFNNLSFLVFCGMCGTDFTEGILTETMIDGILYHTKENDFKIINKQTDIICIVAGILILAAKKKGIIKRLRKPQKYKPLDNLSVKIEDYIENLQYYIEYIKTGIMTDKTFNKVNIPVICREFFYLSGFRGRFFKRKQLMEWIAEIDLDSTLEDL